jgi:hypothetical protein
MIARLVFRGKPHLQKRFVLWRWRLVFLPLAVLQILAVLFAGVGHFLLWVAELIESELSERVWRWSRKGQ